MTDHNPDAPLKNFLGGRYAQRSDGEAPMYVRHPEININTNTENLVEFSDGQGFDTGTTPWTPVYWHYEFNEVTGADELIYSLTPDFSMPYTPLDDVVPTSAIEDSVTLGFEKVVLSAIAQSLTIPVMANAAQIELVGDQHSFAQYSYDGDPSGGVYHRLGDGQALIVHHPNLELFQSVLGAGSPGATLHVHYHFNPNPNEHG